MQVSTVPTVVVVPLRVIVVGAQGHARVCLEALTDEATIQVVGAVSRDGVGAPDLGTPTLGLDVDIAAIALAHRVEKVFVAIGINETRRSAIHRCAELGLGHAIARSRFAMVSHTTLLGAGTAILAGATVNAAATIGRGVIVNTNAAIDHDCVVDDFAHIAPGAIVAGGVTIGEGTLVGIGARVLPNLSIGAWATVGAGAVVTRDVPEGATVVGIPARILER
jgi:UDP-perosamine 4-acetyltransferase